MRVEPWHQKPWDWRAAVQFICGGTGTGLLLFTALASIEDPAWLLRTGLLALALVGLGLFFVWIKLGRRLRALFVILNLRTSWMTREALFSVLLMTFGGLGIVLANPALALVGALFGLGYLYSQARILHAARGIPAWREPANVPLIFLTGLVEGASLFLLADLIIQKTLAWLPPALLLLLVLRLGAWLIYRRRLTAPGAAPLGTVAALQKSNLALTWGGHVLPGVLLVSALALPSTALAAVLFGAVTALTGGWLLKFTVIARAAFNQGFAIKHTPARTPGYGGPGVKPGWSSPQQGTSPEQKMTALPTVPAGKAMTEG